jgi:hypothetical protein
MAAFDYSKAHTVAKDLIEKFGASATVVDLGNTGGFDISGNVLAPESNTNIAGTVTPLLRFRQSEVDGDSVLMSDSYVFFDSTTAPEVDMTITINSELYRIIEVTTLDSVSGVNVYRRLQLRK